MYELRLSSYTHGTPVREKVDEITIFTAAIRRFAEIARYTLHAEQLQRDYIENSRTLACRRYRPQNLYGHKTT